MPLFFSFRTVLCYGFGLYKKAPIFSPKCPGKGIKKKVPQAKVSFQFFHTVNSIFILFCFVLLRNWYLYFKSARRKVTGLKNDYQCDIHEASFCLSPPRHAPFNDLCGPLSLLIGVYVQMGLDFLHRFGKKRKVLEKINSKSDNLRQEAEGLLWRLYTEMSQKYSVLKRENNNEHSFSTLCPIFHKHFFEEYGVRLFFLIHSTSYGKDLIVYKFPQTEFNESYTTVHLHMWSYRGLTYNPGG